MSRTNRRDFLRSTSATAAAGVLISNPLFSLTEAVAKTNPKSPNSKPNLAVVGTGGMGGGQAGTFIKMGANCVAYCDIDKGRWGRLAKQFPKATGYTDYRKMLDKHEKEIDGVTVGTPDHHHYPATIIAMRMGKAVYTQKPLTHTPWEARALFEAWKKYKVPTQMGNQGHANEGWRLLYEWVHSGALGDVKEVHTWTNRPVWPQGIPRPKGEDPIPANLDWDCWIGPAPMRPFKKGVYHPFKWRGWWDFGCGTIGDMGCHTADGLFWAMDPGYPTAVDMISRSGPCDDAYPKKAVVKWEFPAKGKRPAFVAYWYDGGQKPKKPDCLEEKRNLPKTGNLFIGTKATILSSGDYGNSMRIIPEAKMKEIGKPPKMLERSPGHYKEWWMALTGQKPYDFPKSNFGYAGPMTETILLGNIVVKVGKRQQGIPQGLEVLSACRGRLARACRGCLARACRGCLARACRGRLARACRGRLARACRGQTRQMRTNTNKAHGTRSVGFFLYPRAGIDYCIRSLGALESQAQENHQCHESRERT